MQQWLDNYGGPPQDLGRVELATATAEFCFVQYMPIRTPLSGWTIPKSLYWVAPTLFCAFPHATDKYVYLTVRRMYGVNNREGWHTDGFGTDDINFIWYDSCPTEFDVGEFSLTRDHQKSMQEMGEQHNPNNLKVYPERHVIQLTQSNVHRVCPEPFQGLRTFVKISVSDSKYNLLGNSVNPLLQYDWEYVPRQKERNHPVGGK